MWKKWWLALLGWALVFPACACLNEFRPQDRSINAQGKEAPWQPLAHFPGVKEATFQVQLCFWTDMASEGDESYFTDMCFSALKEGWVKWKKDLHQRHIEDLEKREGQYLQSPSFETRNDLAVALLRNGAFDRARTLLEENEREKPDQYQTATNLGTALELLGEPEEALVWIQKGIALNPDSHQGSEWVHVQLLRAQIKEKAEPGWMKRNTLTGVSFGSQPLPPESQVVWPVGNKGIQLDASDFQRHLEAQLGERLVFVESPNILVGGLLHEYAQSMVINQSVRSSFEVSKLAQWFGTPRVEDLKNLQESLADYESAHPLTDGSKWWWTFPLVMAALLLCWRNGQLFFRRKNFVVIKSSVGRAAALFAVSDLMLMVIYPIAWWGLAAWLPVWEARLVGLAAIMLFGSTVLANVGLGRSAFGPAMVVGIATVLSLGMHPEMVIAMGWVFLMMDALIIWGWERTTLRRNHLIPMGWALRIVSATAFVLALLFTGLLVLGIVR